MNKQKKTQLTFEFFIDMFCLICANLLSVFIFHILIFKISNFERIEWIRYDGSLLLSYLVIFFGFHRNLDIQKRGRSSEISNTLKNATATFMLFSVVIVLLKNPIIESRSMLISNYVFYVILSTIGRFFLKRYLTRRFTHSRVASMAGIITTNDRAEDFVKSIKENWAINLRGIVLLDNYCENGIFGFKSITEREMFGAQSVSLKTDFPRIINDVPVISIDSGFMDWVRGAALDEMYINLPYADDYEIQDIVEELEDMGITVHLNIPSLDDILDGSKFNNINCRVQYGYPMATFMPSGHNSVLLTLKRASDVVLGTLGFICSLPIIALVAIPLLKESPGPLIFKQQRVGKNGRFFNIYKLRSMKVNAEEEKEELMEQNKMEGFMFKVDDDPRITKVGKFIRKYSIDELPQFFNVIRGDMSLVGTRPPTVDEFINYESRHKRRLSMRPGITGMWQVSGRSDIQNFEEVVELDCKYIDEWSVWLDIKILFKTVGVVLLHKGAE